MFPFEGQAGDLAAGAAAGQVLDYWWKGLFRACTISLLLVPLLVFGACGEVVGPVASCVGDPADRGVDVHAEQVGEDGGGQVGCEGDGCFVMSRRDPGSVHVHYATRCL